MDVKKYGVQELEQKELVNVDGGGLLTALIILTVFTIVGSSLARKNDNVNFSGGGGTGLLAGGEEHE